MSTTAEPDGGSSPATEQGSIGPRSQLLAFRALRLFTILGIASLLVASATLLLYGAVHTALQIAVLVVPKAYGVANRDIFLSCIKLLDLVLLATIMQVVGIGLYSLLIGKQLPVPRWMMSANIDELKNKLAGIIVILLGVSFLEQLIYWGSERDLMRLGIAVALVIAALSYFIRSHH